MKPLPWAFTTLEMLIQCPRKYHEIKVVKHFKDEMSEVGLWGDRVHKGLANYLTNNTPLEPELARYQTYADAVKAVAGDMYVELKLAIDTNLNPCDFFNGRNLFNRGICDVLHVNKNVGRAIDHKTGKTKPGSRQMKAMAILIFAHFHQIDELRVAFMWLQEGKRDSEVFTRNDIPALWMEFLPDLKQYKTAFENDLWPPRQNGLCKKHCPVISCEFNGRNK